MNRLEAYNYNLPLPQAAENKGLLCETVCDVAKRTFLELVASSVLGAICCAFVATPAGISTIVTGIAIQMAVSLAMRIFVAYHEYQSKLDPEHEIPSLAKWLGATSFSYGS